MIIPTTTVASDLRHTVHSGRTRALRWRTEQLRGIERLLTEEQAAIAEALAEDLGRAPIEAYLADISSTRAEAAYARRHLKKWMRPRQHGVPLTLRPARAWTQFEPLGAILIIGTWNYPVYLSIGPLVGALAAGNAAVLKPSELAPATSALLARVIPQYIDETAVQVVEGDADTTQSLLAQGFDHVLFTGGTDVGRKVMASAAATLTPVTLELGGKSPVVVDADADLAVTARRIVSSKLLNSGQTCIAPDYVLAHRDVAERLVDEISATIRHFRSAEPDLSLPILNARQFDRLTTLIDTTSGRIASGGGRDRERLRIEPTVIAEPSPTDAVMCEEIFGPILPVISVGSIDDAVTFINDRPKPLAIYVFSASQRRARSVIEHTRSGAAVINHVAMHTLVPQLPFGGVGASGMGAYHGRWGFETFSHRRAVLSKPTRPDPRLAYPPYSDRDRTMIHRFL